MALSDDTTYNISVQPDSSQFKKFGSGDFLVQVNGNAGDGAYTIDGDVWLPVIISSNIKLIDFVVLEPSDPAAGDDLDFDLPAGYFYKIDGIQCTLKTSATVANRYMRVIITNSGGKYLNYTDTGSSHSANYTRYYHYSPNYNQDMQREISVTVTDGLGGSFFSPSDIITTSVLNLDATDEILDFKISTFRYNYYNEFIEKNCKQFGFYAGSDDCKVFRVG